MPDINGPVVQHHLYGGPVSGMAMGFSGTPQYIRVPVPGTATRQEYGWSSIMEMATYTRMAWGDRDGTFMHRYIHEDMASYLIGRAR